MMGKIPRSELMRRTVMKTSSLKQKKNGIPGIFVQIASYKCES
jgi:hypothetical protein